MPSGRSGYISALRQELIAQNSSYASLNLLPHVTSYGDLPVVVYQQSECGQHHGNFISASYRAILGNVLFEAKLTEGDFQIQRTELVAQYRDLRDVFECRQLPRAKKKYISYQLIRNVLAAHALGLDFCTLLDALRPDLLEDWYGILRCIQSADLRARCKVLTWQELALCLSSALKNFLDVKYAIVPD